MRSTEIFSGNFLIMLHSKCQIVIPLPRNMALEDAWLFLKDKEYTRGQKSFIDRAKKNLDGQQREVRGFSGGTAAYKGQPYSEAQKKVTEMLKKDFDAVDWEHNTMSGNHQHVQEHIEHAMMRAQMRMHAIGAHQFDHPCLKGDKWFYQPTHFNTPDTTGFDSPTGHLFDEGRPLHEIVGETGSHGAFLWGGVHHQDNQPEGLGAKRPPAVGPPENYPDHAAPGFGVRNQ
jgi:hypothetical protein